MKNKLSLDCSYCVKPYMENKFFVFFSDSLESFFLGCTGLKVRQGERVGEWGKVLMGSETVKPQSPGGDCDTLVQTGLNWIEPSPG